MPGTHSRTQEPSQNCALCGVYLQVRAKETAHYLSHSTEGWEKVVCDKCVDDYLNSGQPRGGCLYGGNDAEIYLGEWVVEKFLGGNMGLMPSGYDVPILCEPHFQQLVQSDQNHSLSIEEVLGNDSTNEPVASSASAVHEHGATSTLETVDPELRDRAVPQFNDGHYQDSVTAAFRVLENRVRELGEYDADKHGASMMTEAFNRGGPLEMGRTKAETEGTMHLYRGAFMALRNPPNHRFVDEIDRGYAQSSLHTVNLLLRILKINHEE